MESHPNGGSMVAAAPTNSRKKKKSRLHSHLFSSAARRFSLMLGRSEAFSNSSICSDYPRQAIAGGRKNPYP